MRGLKRFICILLIGLISVTTCVYADEPDSTDAEVDRLFKKWKTSGGMVVVAKDGEIIYERTYGYADKNAKEKISKDTYFRIASLSKLVTGCVAMRLVEQGKLDLDVNIGEYLASPALEVGNPQYPSITITARMLMSHTSTIKDSGGGFSKDKGLNEILQKKKKNQSNYYKKKPGTYYKYSNYGIGTLGAMIEYITGKKLTVAAKDLLFDEMGIDAGYDPSYLEEPEKITTDYKRNGGVKLTRAWKLRQKYNDKVRINYDYHEGYGSLYIRGEDLCRIGIMLCEGGMADGKQILKEETVAEMLSSQEGRGGITIDSPYGLCVQREKTLIKKKIIYGHQGRLDDILCNLYFDPETHFVFVLLTNGCKSSLDDHTGYLSRQLLDCVWKAFNNK